MSASFGDAKGGGKIVFTSGHDTAYDGGLGTGFKRTWGFLYWRPMQQFRMQVGVNADGDYGAAQISGWGFTGEAKNSVAAVSDYNGWGNQSWPLWTWQSGLTRKGNAFYPGTGDLANINFSIFPTDGLIAHIVLPLGDGVADSGNGNAQNFQDQIADFHLNVKYTIEEMGLINFAFVGKGGLGKDRSNTHSIGNLYASFYLTALSGMNAELGLVYGLPWENAAGAKNDGFLGAGVGFRLDDGGPFTFKIRLNARLMGNTNDNPMDTLIYANILPCYKVSNNLWAFLYAGIGMEMFDGDVDSRLSWFVNPYIWVRASEGLRFWTGLQVLQHGPTENPPVVWRVPFGFNFYF